MAKLDLNIEKIKSVLSNTALLTKNRYRVSITKIGNANSNLSLLISAIDAPALDYTTSDLDIGGHNIGVTSKWQPAEITMTVYNTGNEYKLINEYADKIYNQDTHDFGYYDDVVVDITIEEADRTGNIIQTIQYQRCILRGIGALNFSYDEATSFETFTITFGVGKRVVSYGSSQVNTNNK